jgi:hypothetical protein
MEQSNKGTGAGGKQTTTSGKKFEQITSNFGNLLILGFTQHNKFSGVLKKTFDNQTIYATNQTHFKKFIKSHFGLVCE